MTATVLRSVNNRELEEIIQLTTDCSPVPIQSDSAFAEDLLKFIQNDENIYVVLKSVSGELIGFCGLTPQNIAVRELNIFDAGMSDDDSRFYYEMIGIKETYRKTKAFLRLMLKSVESAKSIGISKFSSHSITTNGINRTVQKLFHDNKVCRQIHNWMGTSHSCDYIEFTVHDKDIERIKRLLK